MSYKITKWRIGLTTFVSEGISFNYLSLDWTSFSVLRLAGLIRATSSNKFKAAFIFFSSFLSQTDVFCLALGPVLFVSWGRGNWILSNCRIIF